MVRIGQDTQQRLTYFKLISEVPGTRQATNGLSSAGLLSPVIWARYLPAVVEYSHVLKGHTCHAIHVLHIIETQKPMTMKSKKKWTLNSSCMSSEITTQDMNLLFNNEPCWNILAGGHETLKRDGLWTQLCMDTEISWVYDNSEYVSKKRGSSNIET